MDPHAVATKSTSSKQDECNGDGVDVAAKDFEDGSSCSDNNDSYDVSEELLGGQGFQHGSIVSPLALIGILVATAST